MCIITLEASEKRLIYLVSDIEIPFWNILAKGIKDQAKKQNYTIEVYSANNLKEKELQNLSIAMQSNIDGLILSPINSSTAVTILKLAKKANIPVVLADIGTQKGEYVSYISSDNFSGGYEIGKILSSKMKQLGWGEIGSVGIVAIPQKRANGKARTDGFIKALTEENIKTAGLLQQVDFSYQETYNHTTELIKTHKNIKAIWLQGSDKYQGALDAINDSGNKNKILLLCFDAEPEFLTMIPKGTILASAMQQPYLMGEIAVKNLVNHIKGNSVKKIIQLEVLAISNDNIKDKLPLIKRNVLGLQ